RIPHDDNSIHEVFLQGTANLKPASSNLPALLAEAFRVLRPGGTVRVHGLTGDTVLASALPPMPGPAAAVQHVPAHVEVLHAVVKAGFVDVAFEKLSQTAHFTIEGVPMRESMTAGRKPGHRPVKLSHKAIYLGPSAQVTDDFGNVFRR